MSDTPSPQTLTDAYWALLDNANKLCEGADVLLTLCMNGYALTLAITALEESSKARDLSDWYFATSRDSEHDVNDMINRWRRHEVKLLASLLEDVRQEAHESYADLRRPGTLEEFVDDVVGSYVQIREHVNATSAARNSGLYVDIDGDVIKKPADVSRDDAIEALEKARKHLASLRLKPITRRAPGGASPAPE